MTPPNIIDAFLVYALLPLIAITGLIANRMYFKSKSQYFQGDKKQERKFKLSRNLILGNIVLGAATIGIILLLYTYIINFNQYQNNKGELIAAYLITLLAFALGIGIGSHVTVITIKNLMPDNNQNNKNRLLHDALHFFHYPFSHKIPYTAMLLMIYILNVLDLYKGKNIQLSIYAKTCTAAAGISIGAFTAILLILAKSQKMMIRAIITILISIHLLLINESINITNHPLSLMFISIYWTIFIALIIQKQSRIDIRTPAKKIIKKWLHWDIDII